jgi:hypothetical protein
MRYHHFWRCDDAIFGDLDSLVPVQPIHVHVDDAVMKSDLCLWGMPSVVACLKKDRKAATINVGVGAKQIELKARAEGHRPAH